MVKRAVLWGAAVFLLLAAHGPNVLADTGGPGTGSSATAVVVTAVPSAAVEAHVPDIGMTLPIAWILPFVVMLLCIAVFPLVAEHWWESNLNKLIVACFLGIPTGGYILFLDWHKVVHVGGEYFAFITLLASLYIISGGIVLKGRLRPSPQVNTLILAIGGVIASFMGTTGAAMVLIRPLLSANAPRKNKVHTVIFFIFIVANCGGALTPLGDPPLFMGYLRGVPFTWTFGLMPAWATMVAMLLAVYYVWDSRLWKREPEEAKQTIPKEDAGLAVEGMWTNVPLLAGVVCCVAFGAHWPNLYEGIGLREAAMWALAGASWVLTPRQLRKDNKFTMHPIVEVAVLFFGIFLTMIPALAILGARGSELGVTHPVHFYWVTGVLSSFLDNAPTYLVFFSLAQGITDIGAWQAPMVTDALVARVPESILAAISLGAVFMGANTYIGNGPNFMVKAIADERGVKMPSFFGYMLYSIGILLPLLIIINLIFV